jgi:hypothetical protein
VTPERQYRRRGIREARLSRRQAVVILSVAVIGTGTVLALALRSVDRRSYVAENLQLLGALPRYPGSHLIEVDEQPEKGTEWTFAPTVGYTTHEVFKVRRGIRATTILSFYERAITPHWHLTDKYPWAGQSNFRRGNAYLQITARQGEIDVELDHDFY